MEEVKSKFLLFFRNNNPLLPAEAISKKKKDCCKSFKDGKRCKKCPGRK